MQKYLIQFSGGKDALAATFKILEIAPEGSIIDLFHLQTIFNQTRDFERQVARWIVQLECAYRQFKYIKYNYPKFDISFISPQYSAEISQNYDVIFLQPLSCALAFQRKYNVLVRGVTKFNVDRVGVKHPHIGFPAQEESWDFYEKAHYKYIADSYFSFSNSFCLEESPIFLNPLVDCDDILGLIPEELHSSMWACERPVRIGHLVKHCRSLACKKCKREEPGTIHTDIELVHTKDILDGYLAYRKIVLDNLS
jgi:hypothetical protein